MPSTGFSSVIRRALVTGALLGSTVGLMPSGPATAASGSQITKLMVYMLENTSQSTAYANMPYLSGLAAQYGKATNYVDVTHPSEGNYVEMVSGQGAATCGLADPLPANCRQPGGTVFGEAIAHGLSSKLYQEGMSSNCSTSGDYGHNPWLFFPAEAGLCQQFDVPSGEPSGGNLAGDIAAGALPNAGMVVPNDSNNGHSGSLATADAYLHSWMNLIQSGPDWKSGHLAVVITFDEGESSEDVADVVVSPTVAPGTVFSSRANHDSTGRLYSEVLNAPPLNNAAGATDLAGPFNIGTAAGPRLNAPVVGMAPSPSGHGYWLAASDGGIFTFGDAGFFGSTGGVRLNKPVVGMAPTPTGRGYWLVASDGGVFTFGDAGFFGSTGGIPLNKPVVGIAATPTGHGYWLVASDGGIFTFGDATFAGSTGGIPLNKPVVGMAPTSTGRGYWLVASDGGIFTFGDARFLGSTGGVHLNRPVVGMAAEPAGNGYWLVASDGGVFTFGAPFFGSLGAAPPAGAVVGMARFGGSGYFIAGSDGAVYAFGAAPWLGNA